MSCSTIQLSSLNVSKKPNTVLFAGIQQNIYKETIQGTVQQQQLWNFLIPFFFHIYEDSSTAFNNLVSALKMTNKLISFKQALSNKISIQRTQCLQIFPSCASIIILRNHCSTIRFHLTKHGKQVKKKTNIRF